MKLTLLSLLVFVQILIQPPLYASQNQACAEQLAKLNPIEGELPHIDEADMKAVQQRKGAYQRLRAMLFGDQYKITEEDTDSVKALKALMSKREFSTYFRFSDQTQKNLDKKVDDFKGMVKPLKTPQEGYLAKLMIIRQAEYTVDLAYYIYARDNAGHAIVHELKDALKRGVNVRVMVDSLGSVSGSLRGNPHFKSLITYAKNNAGYIKDPATGKPTNVKAKVEILVFNPVTNVLSPLRDLFVKAYLRIFKNQEFQGARWNFNRRSHDKMIVADAEFPSRAVAVVGGRNIADRYYNLDPKDTGNFRDSEALIRNHPDNYNSPVAFTSVGELLTDQFDRLYFHRSNRRIEEGVIGKIFGREKDHKIHEKAANQIEDVVWPTLKEIGEDYRSPQFGRKYLTEGFMEAEKINVFNTMQNILKNIPEPLEHLFAGLVVNGNLKNQADILTKIAEDFAHENESVTIISPYLWLSDGSKPGTINEIQFIKNWLKANPNRHLYVYTNSTLTSDNPMTQSMVDVASIPRLMMDKEMQGRVTVYAYGKIDDVVLGGNKNYGKLHHKGVYFKGLKKKVETTFNKDPRSQYINSEMAVPIQSVGYGVYSEKEIADIQANSHLWGSAEYTAIRTHKNLPLKNRLAIKHEARIIKFLEDAPGPMQPFVNVFYTFLWSAL